MPYANGAQTNAGLGTGFGGGLFGNSNCCCSFPTLIILILIVLQFSRNNNRSNNRSDEDCDDGEGLGGNNGIIDNGILFIIALFYLSCCGAGCGKGIFGGGCGAY
ncbi:MAG: hypothetical protein Q8936_12335 [Bacillota bacterium]|nr:hypothetical protein [Bacillota bacterium]